MKILPSMGDELEGPAVRLEGEDGCGVSFVEAIKHQQEWQSIDQIEIHKMRIYSIFEMFYADKLDEVLDKAHRIVQIAIDYSAIVEWEITGGYRVVEHDCAFHNTMGVAGAPVILAVVPANLPVACLRGCC